MPRLCVVFDVDDTLYLERDYAASGFEAVGKWAERWLGVGGLGSHCWAAFQRGCRGNIFDSALRDLGYSATPEILSALVSIYRTHKPAIALAEDAAECLRSLNPLVTLAIISDGPLVSQIRKVEALGLTSITHPIVLTELFGRDFSKPNPFAYQYVQSNVAADRFVYVGDNPAKDFSGPQELGWTTVRIRRPCGLHYSRPNSLPLPDYEFSDCGFLPECLRDL